MTASEAAEIITNLKIEISSLKRKLKEHKGNGKSDKNNHTNAEVGWTSASADNEVDQMMSQVMERSHLHL